MEALRGLYMGVLAALLILAGCLGGGVIDDTEGQGSGTTTETTTVNNYHHYYNNTTYVVHEEPELRLITNLPGEDLYLNTSAGEAIHLVQHWTGEVSNDPSWKYWDEYIRLEWTCGTSGGISDYGLAFESQGFLPTDGGACNYRFYQPDNPTAAWQTAVLYQIHPLAQ